MISYHYLNELSKGKLETAIFNRVSKAKTRLHLFCLTSLCDWSGNSRHSLNQSDAKPKQITTWSPAFSRALDSLVVFTPSSHWLLMFFSFLLIRFCDYFGHSIEKHSICGTDDSEKQIGLFKNKWAPTKMSECHVFFPYTTP